MTILAIVFTQISTIQTISETMNNRKQENKSGPDLGEGEIGGGKLGSCPAPPQLSGLHKKQYKNIFLPKET